MMIADRQARERALDISRSLAVAAPAGSGKTSLLVRRVLRLLAISERPEEILAITFTRKAANEMRERILQALRDAADNSPTEQPHERELRSEAAAALARNGELGWNLLENPSRLKIQTFDSFCRYLARRMALETGSLPPSNQLENALPEYRLAVRQLLQIDPSSPFQPILKSLSEQFDGNLDALVDQFSRLLEARADWLELAVSDGLNPHSLQDNLTLLVEGQLARCQAVLRDTGLLQELNELASFSFSHREEIPSEWIGTDFGAPDSIQADWLPRWKAMLELLFTKTGIRKQVSKAIGFPTAKEGGDDGQKSRLKKILGDLPENPRLAQELGYVQALPDISQAAGTLQSLEQLSRFLPLLAAQLQLDFQERQQTDYTGIAIRALQALGEEENPTSLALRLDYRIRHILVDEFQDTSALQVQLIERLTAGWQPDDGRSLFVVGDPMQSIYEFRRARVELFIRAREAGIGQIPLEPVDLSCNFRSDQNLVSWVNQCFADLFPDQDDPFRGQVRYRASSAERGELGQYQLTAAGFTDEQAELTQVADAIARQVAQGDRDIAVLTRKRADLALLAPLLKARDVEIQMHNVEFLGQCQHVMDLHSLVRALHSCADRIAWLSLLRSPVAGLDNNDLWRLVSGDDPERKKTPVWHQILHCEQAQGLSESAQAILCGFRSHLRGPIASLGRCDLRGLVETTWRQLGGWQSLLQPHHSQDLEDYLALLETHSRSGIIEDFDRFESDLEKLYARPAGDDSAPVKLMTIYAAKGLEFDSLYLPRLDSSTGSYTKPVLVWRDRITADGERHFYAACKPRRGESCQLYDFLCNEESTRRQDELSRLLYVACTRAKRRLHLSGVVKYNEEKAEWRAPAKGTLLALLWRAMQAQFTPAAPPDENVEMDVPVLDRIRRLPPGRFGQEFPDPVQPQSAELEHMQPNVLRANLEQRVLGDLVHEYLQRRANGSIPPSSAHRDGRWQAQLMARGLSGERLNQGMAYLQQLVESIDNSGTAAWILDSDHTDAACEVEYVRRDRVGGLQHLVIDRTFIDSGTRWIIDYKSSTPAPHQPLDSFLEQQVERYSAQMKNYRQLFPNDRVRTALYFPALDHLQEIGG